MTLPACMTVKRGDVPPAIKQSFDWNNLSTKDKLDVFNVSSPVEVYGTGSVQVSPDGTVSADTSTKARVAGEIINNAMQTAAGLAKEGAGIF